jgi:DNA-binding PadR family transcriptional regulator
MLTLDSSSKRRVKDYIIDILSREYPLSARKIHNRVKAAGMDVTYHAVYKVLHAMLKEGKLTKNRAEFSIDIGWIHRLKKIIDDVERTYAGEKKLPALEDFQKENSSAVLHFKNYEEADAFRKEIQWTYLREKREKPYCGLYKHLKTPVIYSHKSVYEVRHLKNEKISTFLAVSSDTPIDKWCARLYAKNPRVSVKTGLNLSSADECETMVLGDIVVQIYIPENIRKITEEIYKKTKNMDNIDRIEFYEKIYRTPSDIKIVVFNNTHMAELLRKQIISYF